jgi:cobalamin biosynthesis protein CobD/CbiB
MTIRRHYNPASTIGIPAVSLLALLACLAAQYAFPPRGRHPLMAFYGRLALEARRRLDAGDRNSGIVAWFALVVLVAGPVALATALAGALHPVLVWLLDIAVLYFTLRFLDTTRELAAIERALRAGDTADAAVRLALWRGEPVEAADPGTVARLAAEHGLREAHYGSLGMLFWYLVLPGPVGLVLYPLAYRAARAWSLTEDPADRDFGWFAQRAFDVIDWIPQRLTACAFAVVGDFEDALYCWRSQAATWSPQGEGIVLASGAGALGVRLGEAVPGAEGLEARPPLGVGEAAGEESLASLEGLLWRAWVLWMIVFLLAAALHP